MTESQLIKDCQRGNRKAQKALYDLYARKMMALCMRYGGDRVTAEDILQEGFIRVFTHIGEYSGDGVFEGWIRRVFVNSALMYLRQRHSILMQESLDVVTEIIEDTPMAQMTAEELMNLVQGLPAGFRTIFNLYAIEGYSHSEIADMLGIAEGTCRSQYARARQVLQMRIKKLYDN